MTPFDIINIINEKKDHDRSEVCSYYNPYIINRGLSMVKDTLFFANELNQRSQLDKDIQFDFLFNSVPKGKKWGKWMKPDSLETDLYAVMRHFRINRSVGEQYLKLLSKEQIEEIHEKQNHGGKKR